METETLGKTALTYPQRAARIVVVDAETYAAGAHFVVECRAFEKKIEAEIEPLITAANKSHKLLTAKRAELLAPLMQARTLADRALASYRNAQDEIQRKMERELREAATKVAESVRIEQAIKAEAAGNKALAEKLITAPIQVIAPVLSQATAPKVGGYRANPACWRARAIPGQEHIIPREHLIPNIPALCALAKCLKEAMSIPGIEAYDENK